MRNFLMWLAMFVLMSVIVHFLWAQRQGRVSGTHPIARKLAWIERVEHPRHYWSYTLLHGLIYVVLGWVLFGLWNRPVY